MQQTSSPDAQPYLVGLRNFFAQPYVRAFAALALMLLLGGIFHADGAFYKWGTHRDMLRQISEHGILACGLTIVIISGGIDLAVGSVLGLVAVACALFSIHWGWSAPAVIAACFCTGAACGAAPGLLIARFQMQPFIATLAMMVFARGLAKFISGGEKISQAMQQPDGSFAYVELPRLLALLDTRVLGGNIAVVTIVFLVCITLTGLLMHFTQVGRHLYAIGGNEDAARLSGVPVARRKIAAYVLCGIFAAIAGMCHAAQETQGDPEAGVSYELTAIAIVVIGGTSLNGGRGSVLLTLLGTLTIGYLEKILSINAVGEASRLMLTGGIIAAAVLLQRSRRT